MLVMTYNSRFLGWVLETSGGLTPGNHRLAKNSLFFQLDLQFQNSDFSNNVWTFNNKYFLPKLDFFSQHRSYLETSI